jgi:hypothetical protein
MQIKTISDICDNATQEINGMTQHEIKQRLAEAVRQACLKAAREGYENAGISGLCEEGRWECAVDAIRALDIEAVIASLRDDATN